MRAPLLTLLLCACAADAPTPPPEPSACAEQRFEQAGFVVCTADRVEVRTGVRSFNALAARLGPRAGEIAFAMNGGMFDDAGAPIGLAIEDGREIHGLNRRAGSGNFHLQPNGVFLVRKDGRAAVATSASYKTASDIAFATQSGPMLVIDGKLHPRFEPDGSSRYVRNGVGIAPDGRPLFVITTDLVSLGKFARFFRDRLHARNALYLDGSVSSLWDPADGRMDDFADLGPMIVGFKAAESAPGREGRARP